MRTWPGSSWRVPCPQRSQGSTWLGSPCSQSFALRIKHQRILRLLTNGKPYLKARLSNICLVHWSQHRQGCFRGRLPVAWDSRELKKQWHLTILVYSSLFKRLNNLSSWIWKKQWHLTIHLAILVFRLDCIRVSDLSSSISGSSPPTRFRSSSHYQEKIMSHPRCSAQTYFRQI